MKSTGGPTTSDPTLETQSGRSVDGIGFDRIAVATGVWF